MNIYRGTRSIALRRDMEALSIFYEERSAANPRKLLNLSKPPVPGLSFFFHGLVLGDCEHFAIDFLGCRQGAKNNLGDCDILLQIGARLPQNYIVRNSRLMGKWGPEENASNTPFLLKRGKTFWMQVLLTDKCFYISLNGFHLTKYTYRMPYRWLTAVDVRGDVSDIVIETFYVSEYPIRVSNSAAKPLSYVSEIQDNHTMPADWLRIDIPSKFLVEMGSRQAQLPLPFYGRMQPNKKLTEGRSLRIEGRVCLMPQSFSVALQRGQNIWPQPTVSLLFYPSFLRNSRAKVGKAVITRSAYINGMWVNRAVSRLHTYLEPGKAFVIVIACGKQSYEVFVNTKLLLIFKHQMNPADVDIVNIRGDVKLCSVVVQSTRLS